MSFPQDVKARIFVRSARICALCYKQCGTNIEAAHIVAEADGGTNDDDNAIPLCFDCHQEIGAYDPRHPRGNKFSDVELKARRDQLYQLVDTGTLQALIVVNRLLGRDVDIRHSKAMSLHDTLRDVPPPSVEAQAVLDYATRDWGASRALAEKLKLLSEGDCAFVMDQLVHKFADEVAGSSLAAILKSDLLSIESKTVIVERLLRHATLIGDVAEKSRLMNLLPTDLIRSTDTGLRHAFFSEIIAIMQRDQFSEVNLVTPAVVKAHEAIPDELHRDYMDALLDQADSNAWDGAPAAQSALKSLPDAFARAGIDALNVQQLLYRHGDHFKDFVRQYRNLWKKEQTELLNDFVNLSHYDFVQRQWSKTRGTNEA